MPNSVQELGNALDSSPQTRGNILTTSILYYRPFITRWKQRRRKWIDHFWKALLGVEWIAAWKSRQEVSAETLYCRRYRITHIAGLILHLMNAERSYSRWNLEDSRSLYTDKNGLRFRVNFKGTVLVKIFNIYQLVTPNLFTVVSILVLYNNFMSRPCRSVQYPPTLLNTTLSGLFMNIIFGND